ncbi:unnamed protein product [Scytosiphon promiscuus]
MRSSPSAPYAVGGVLYRGSGVMAMLLVMCCVARLAGGFNLVRIAPSACTSGGSSSTTSSKSIPSRLSAVKTSSAPTSAVSSSRASRGQDDKFDWHKQWYPVLSERDSDPDRAHAVQLLGKDLVVWKNNEGRWSTFDDRCPHRAAPLTQGRIEKDGSLLCTYHAWRFDADGKCLSIPQSDRGGKDEASPRACMKPYPTQVAQEIVWVWADNGPDAVLESLLTKPALVSALEDKEGIKSGKVLPGRLTQRDLAYGWDTFFENIMDPAHVVVSHHGVMGKRSMAKPIELKAVPEMTKDGFVVDNNSPQFGAKQGIATFYPPSLVEIVTELGDGTLISLVQYNIPTRPGWSRMLNRQMTVKPKETQDADVKKKKAFSPLKLLARLSPVKLKLAPNEQRAWVQHILSHLFVHQDMPLLHHQEKIMYKSGHTGSRWSKGIYTPTVSDKGVHTMRKWIAKFGSGGPPWEEGCDTSMPPREQNPEIICDIYQQHTKYCTSCLGALKRVEQCIQAAKVSTVLSLTWAAVRAASAANINAAASPPARFTNLVVARAMLPGVLSTFASLWAIKKLSSLRQMFYVYTYSHQDHD